MDAWAQDFRLACRLLNRYRTVTIAATLTLAIGIAANLTIFTIVNRVLLRPLPFDAANAIVRLEERHPRSGPANLTGATLADIRARVRSLETVAAFRVAPWNLSDEGAPESVAVARVTDGYFDVFRVRALYGRVFTPADHADGAERVTLLGHAIWARRYGANPNAVGRLVELDGIPHRVIGVMPAGLEFPDAADLWLPMLPAQTLPQNRRAHLFTTVGRARASAAEVNAELAAVAPLLEREGDDDAGFALEATPLRDRLVAPVRTALLVLWGAVGFVLLIACANVANLLVVQGSSRAREMAVRAALGAHRGRLVRQLLIESLVLAIPGGALGLLLAAWGIRLAGAALPATLPRAERLVIDMPTLAFAAALSLAAGMLFGLVPALRAPRTSLQTALADRGATAGARDGNLRWALAAGEIALTLMLLTGAGLLGRSYLRLQQVDPGFDPSNVLTMQLSLPDARYRTLAEEVAFFDGLMSRARALPGVEAAGVTSALPTRPTAATSMATDQPPGTGADRSAFIVTASPGFFRAMRIPVRRGRVFDEADAGGRAVAVVVNETLANRFWSGKDPIGQRLTMLEWGDPLPGIVIGVVGDVRHEGIDTAAPAIAYYALAQFPESTLSRTLVVRTTGVPPQSLAAAVRDQVWALDRHQPVSHVQSLDAALAGSIGQRRFNLILLGTFAAAALLLAAVGVYGVISQSVLQRTREIGVRVALGATPAAVVGLVLKQGLGIAAAGVAAGIAGAAVVSRFLESLLFGVEPGDPATLTAASALLAAVALAAAWAPARRALGVDPVVALRGE